jgi:hypothetical protein
MVSIDLPCSSHRGCTYHYTTVAPNIGLYTSSGIVSWSPRGSEATSTKTPLDALCSFCAIPTELLFMVISYLTTNEQACLSLTCKHFAAILGPSLWPLTSKAKGASWRKHDEFLDILQYVTPGYEFHHNSKRAHRSFETLHSGSHLYKLC